MAMCETCHSEDIIYDNYAYICQNCGLVIEEANFVHQNVSKDQYPKNVEFVKKQPIKSHLASYTRLEQMVNLKSAHLRQFCEHNRVDNIMMKYFYTKFSDQQEACNQLKYYLIKLEKETPPFPLFKIAFVMYYYLSNQKENGLGHYLEYVKSFSRLTNRKFREIVNYLLKVNIDNVKLDFLPQIAHKHQKKIDIQISVQQKYFNQVNVILNNALNRLNINNIKHIHQKTILNSNLILENYKIETRNLVQKLDYYKISMLLPKTTANVILNHVMKNTFHQKYIASLCGVSSGAITSVLSLLDTKISKNDLLPYFLKA